MATGLGLRDPWPADEPRFALVAQDMLRSGDWLFPRVGGDLYADKPPLFFWLMAASMALTGSLQVGFLLPSLLAGIGTTLLVYDLLRRARGREVALAGAFVLLITFQFVWQARQAQIDGVLCFFTTLSLYGLLRHLVLGPAPGWYLAGWAAAGFGVITKGVGFLPLLALIPHAILARRGWPAPAHGLRGLPLAGAATLLVAIGVWFVPMMIASSAGGDLLDYRNEILFHADGHALRGRLASPRAGLVLLHERDSGALAAADRAGAVALAALADGVARARHAGGRAARLGRHRAAVLLVELRQARRLRAAGRAGARDGGGAVAAGTAARARAAASRVRARDRCCTALTAAARRLLCGGRARGGAHRRSGSRCNPCCRSRIVAIAGAAAIWLLRERDGWLAYAATLGILLATVGFVVYPRIDADRSGRAFMARVEEASAGIAELGLVGAKEQYLLQLRRPSTNFGHARWRRGRSGGGGRGGLARRSDPAGRCS